MGGCDRSHRCGRIIEMERHAVNIFLRCRWASSVTYRPQMGAEIVTAPLHELDQFGSVEKTVESRWND